MQYIDLHIHMYTWQAFDFSILNRALRGVLETRNFNTPY